MEIDLGFINEEKYTMGINGLLERILVVGGADKDQDQLVLSHWLKQCLSKNYTTWVIQADKNFLQDDFKQHLEIRNNENSDLIEIEQHHEDNINEILVGAKKSNRDLYFSFKDKSEKLISSVFQSLNGILEKEVNEKQENRKLWMEKNRKPLVLIVTDMNQYCSDFWMNLSIYSKTIGCVFIPHISDCSKLYESMMDDEKSWVVSSVVESCNTKIIFQQDSKQDNIAVSRLFNIPLMVKNRFFTGEQEITFLNNIKKNECLLVANSNISLIQLNIPVSQANKRA